MKKYFKKILLSIFSAFAVSICVCIVFIFLLYGSNSFRKFLITEVNKHLLPSLSCELNVIDGEKYSSLDFKTDLYEMHLKDISMYRGNGFFDPWNVRIKRVKLCKIKNNISVADDKNIDTAALFTNIAQCVVDKIPKIIYWVHKVIYKAQVESIVFDNDDKRNNIRDFCAVFGENKMDLRCDIDAKYFVNASASLVNSAVKLDVTYRDLKRIYGSINCICHSDENIEIKSSNTYEKTKIICHGNYNKASNNMLVADCFIENNLRVYCFSVDATTHKNGILVAIKTDLAQFDIGNMPFEFSEKLRNLTAQINLQYIFNEPKPLVASVLISQDEEYLCDFLINESMEIVGDLSKINLFGFQLKFVKGNMQTKNEVTNVYLKFVGDNFALSSSLEFDKNLIIKDLHLSCDKCGFIKTVSPISMDNYSNIAFVCDYVDASFWKPVLGDISGDIKGNLSFKNSVLSLNLTSKNIAFNDCRLSNCGISINNNDYNLYAKKCNFLKQTIDNLVLSVRNEKFHAQSDLNSYAKIVMDGTLKKRSLLLHYFCIKSSMIDMLFENFIFNINDGIESSFICSVLDKKKTLFGTIKTFFNKDLFTIKAQNFSLNKMASILNIVHSNGVVNADLEMKSFNDLLLGKAELNVTKLFSNDNAIRCKMDFSNNAISLKSIISNFDQKLMFDVTLHNAKITNKLKFVYDLYGGCISSHIYGKVGLDNMLSFSDDVDIRGNIDCDLHIDGNLKKPKLNGFLHCKNVYLFIYGVLLKNGNLRFVGNGSDILNLEKSEFIDSYKRKLKIDGFGRLFFEKSLPDIDTNLDFSCHNFRLLDSDDLIVDVIGNGKLSGPIKKLLISGNVKIPKCEIINFSLPEEDDEMSDILVNGEDVFGYYDESGDKQPSKKKSFLTYNVNMDCRNINIIGNIFEISMFGKLLLSTHDGCTTLSGVTNLKKGRIDFFGKRIKFKKGRAEFFKEYPFNPQASFICTKVFDDTSVSIVVKNSPKLGSDILITSSPYYTVDVLLSKIIFGKDTSELSISEAAQLANLVNSFNNKGGYMFSMLNSVQKTGLIDSLSFGSAKQNTSTLLESEKSSVRSNANVSAGKYLGDDLFISINKSDDDTSCDVDYAINSNLSMKANTKGEVGVSWKYRY